jgi:hypothetical protein
MLRQMSAVVWLTNAPRAAELGLRGCRDTALLLLLRHLLTHCNTAADELLLLNMHMERFAKVHNTFVLRAADQAPALYTHA